MHKWFEETGVPSFIERIDGFELNYAHVIRYLVEGSDASLGKYVDESKWHSLIWGDSKPTTYKLWKVYYLPNKCTE